MNPHQIPSILKDDGSISEPSLTLRDRFAMAALTGIVSHPAAADLMPEDAPKVAAGCYLMADAMMKARQG